MVNEASRCCGSTSGAAPYRYVPDRVVLNRFDVLTRVSTAPAPVLLAQKFHCILARRRTMGRDFYDASYLMGATSPDMRYLDEKLGLGDLESLRQAVLRKCGEADLRGCARDVDPFVTDPADTQRVLLFPELMAQWRPGG